MNVRRMRKVQGPGVWFSPIGQTLALAGLRSLASNATYMQYANHASRADGNRHYLYKNGVGWTAEGVSLTRTEAKYDIISAVLETIGAGQLGRNGRLEPAATNLLNTDISAWPIQPATATVAEDDHYILTIADSSEVVRSNVSPGAQAIGSVFVRLHAGAGAATHIRMTTNDINAWDTGFSTKVALTSSWQRITGVHPSSAGAAFMLGGRDVGGNGDTDCVGKVDVKLPQFETTKYNTSSIPGNAATRSADALRLTGLSGLSAQGGLCAMLRLPYASTVPAADQYHLSLNGSDSTDDGVFVYTKASDDHLYAELRSGGASEGTVDLGAYSADTQYALALGWSSAGLVAAINGVEKTATSAVTVPASIDRLELGRGISTGTAHGGEIPFALILDRLPTLAERAALSGATFNTAIWTGL